MSVANLFNVNPDNIHAENFKSDNLDTAIAEPLNLGIDTATRVNIGNIADPIPLYINGVLYRPSVEGTYASAVWTLAGGNSPEIVTVNTGSPLPLNTITYNRGFIFNAVTHQLFVPSTGMYQIHWGYANVKGENGYLPQSISLYANGISLGANYTLQEQLNLDPTPALFHSVNGQSTTSLLQLNEGVGLSLVNTTDILLKFTGTTSLSSVGQVGALTAWITVNRIY